MNLDRRDFLKQASLSLGAASALTTAGTRALAKAEAPRGKAQACIMLWLSGGPAQIDTFDPKPRGDGKKKAGSAYASINTAVPGVQVSEHLPKVAKRLERCVLMRTLHHDAVDEHAAATNVMHTGRLPNGTIVYPSLGSVISHELGPGGDVAPPYALIGYPSISRGPGFLGAKHGFISLVNATEGPKGLATPPEIAANPHRLDRRKALLDSLRDEYSQSHADDKAIGDYIDASRQASRLAGPEFQKVFALDREPNSVRQAYGGEFGQRCLLARRLVDAGTRFVEVAHNLNWVNGTGWDTHNEGQLNQHKLIKEVDDAVAALIDDLERLKKLDQVLIVVAGEFGRPAEFDAGGGRGHQSHSFSALLAGGGLRTGRAVGVTDELAKKTLERPTPVADFHATIYQTLGINPAKTLFGDGRPVPITDHGRAVAELFG